MILRTVASSHIAPRLVVRTQPAAMRSQATAPRQGHRGVVQRKIVAQTGEGGTRYYSTLDPLKLFHTESEAIAHEQYIAAVRIQAVVRGHLERTRPTRILSRIYQDPEHGLPEFLSTHAPLSSSPVSASRELLHYARRDPNTVVQDHLKKSQVPGLSDKPFSGQREGGGFLLTQREFRVPKKATVPKWIETGKNLEFHPGGGIHSAYAPSTDEGGGSYVRVGDYRIGRHGAFGSKETFDRKPIEIIRPPKQSPSASGQSSAPIPIPTAVSTRPQKPSSSASRQSSAPILIPTTATTSAYPVELVLDLSGVVQAFGCPSPSMAQSYAHKLYGLSYKCVGADSTGKYTFRVV